VHAIGNGHDRHFLDWAVGPDTLPHLAGHFAMELAHTVNATGGPQGKYRHVEGGSPYFVVPAEGEKLVPRDPELGPVVAEVLLYRVEGKRVMASRYRRMCRE
jgi:hypothetical protein